MPKIRLHNTDRYGAATLTASSEATALPVEASQDVDRSYIWRSLTETGTQEIDIDLGSVLAVTAAAVANVKLVGTGVLELYERGDGGSPGSATLVDTLSTQDGDRRTAYVHFGSESHRHWQLKWTNPTSASDYAELGFAFLGTYFEPAVNVNPPRMAESDPSVVRASVDGQRRTAARTRVLSGAWQWTDISAADRDSLAALWTSHGARIPLFATLDTSLDWTTVFHYLTANLEQPFKPVAGLYDFGLGWREVT